VPRRVDSYLEWVTERPASVWRWLLLIPIFGLALLVGPVLTLPLAALFPDGRVRDLVATVSQFPGTLIVFAGLAALVLWRPVWLFAFRRRRPEWGLMGTGMALQLVVSMVMMLAYGLTGVIKIQHETPDVGLLVAMIPIALVGILIQTLTEEFITRGAMPQLVFRVTTNPVFVIALPAVLFASLHLNNVDAFGGGGVLALTPYFLIGVLFGWIAWRTGSIWMSWGMHFASNAFLALVIGAEGDVYETASGLTFTFADPTTWTLVWTDGSITILTAVLVWWLVLRRRPNMGQLARARRAEPSEPAEPAEPTSEPVH
jgi:membrane protease YdiL (CAAX protease family)